MSTTLTEKNLGNDVLRKYLARQTVKTSHTIDDLYRNSVADDDGIEVDQFLREMANQRAEKDDRRRLD